MSAKTTRVGVAWDKQTPDGGHFISVVITNPTGPDFRFTLWPVREKRGEFSPDFDVTKQSDSAAQANASAPAAAKPGQYVGTGRANASARGTAYIPSNSEPGDPGPEPSDGDDEIPF